MCSQWCTLKQLPDIRSVIMIRKYLRMWETMQSIIFWRTIRTRKNERTEGGACVRDDYNGERIVLVFLLQPREAVIIARFPVTTSHAVHFIVHLQGMYILFYWSNGKLDSYDWHQRVFMATYVYVYVYLPEAP